MRDKATGMFWGGIALVAVLAVIALGTKACSSYTAKRTLTTTVTDKERVCSGSSSCQYLVYTDAGTFRLTDSFLIGRFNTSDLYGHVKRCHKYKLQVYGWRFGFTNSYPNISDMTDEGKVAGCES